MITNNFPISKYRVLINVFTLEPRLSMDLAHPLAVVRGKLLNLHHCHNPSLLCTCSMCEDHTIFYNLFLLNLLEISKTTYAIKNISALTREAHNGVTPGKCVTSTSMFI